MRVARKIFTVSMKYEVWYYHIVTGNVEEVLEVLVPRAEQRPHRAGALVDVLCFSLSSVVAQKRAVETRVRVLHQLDLHERGG